jgi:phosphocarrier protein HPr
LGSSKSDTIVIEATIRNIKGLHARASAKFVKCAETFDAEVTVYRDDLSVTATSIMGLMMLAAGPGTVLRLKGEGPEAKAALDALKNLIDCGFDEECVTARNATSEG